jgi:hypothetical protein
MALKEEIPDICFGAGSNFLSKEVYQRQYCNVKSFCTPNMHQKDTPHKYSQNIIPEVKVGLKFQTNLMFRDVKWR